MRVVQIVPTLAYGDAIGNEVFAFKRLIKSLGYITEIYTSSIVPPLNRKCAKLIDNKINFSESDIIIYHLSTGSKLNYQLAEFKGRKVVVYHNVTPPDFFEPYDRASYNLNTEAMKEVKFLADKVDYCLADSEFNKQDLINLGYKCKIDVLEILLSFDEYKKKPNLQTLSFYADNRVNLLFTGRIAPNKKIENIISTFYQYKKNYNPSARLFLVGSYKDGDLYYRKLMKYIKELKLSDVIFTGHIPFDEILSYYKLADVFLCMSEHEGFCVPLVEAMLFDVPILAYDKCAIKDTLSGAGILFENNDPLYTAALVDRIVRDESLKRKNIYNQQKRLQDFQTKKIATKFEYFIKKFIAGEQT